MGIEIERRFLVFTCPSLEKIIPDTIVQGYLNTDPARTVRIRRRNNDGYLTIKGKKTGASAEEFEYSLPSVDLPDLLALCGQNLVEKERFSILGPDGKLWEVDVFSGRHQGLIIAEIELGDESEAFIKPEWLGPEITDDARFSNARLATADVAEIKTWIMEYDPH